jgi:membrane protease subunit HflK
MNLMDEKETFNFEQLKIPAQLPALIRYGVITIVLLLFLYSTFFTISPEEVGVILRFGKFSHLASPGLNLKIPFGIDKLTKVPVQRQLKEEFGFRTAEANIRTRYEQKSYLSESLMLTGDLNAAEVEWIVQYRINDPYLYLFKVRDTRQTFRAMTEAVMREVVGDRTVNEVLTIGRQEISVAVQIKLQELCHQYETGIKVDQVVLQDVNPPERVKPSFNEVNEAQQEREKLINQARSEFNKVIPRASGEAEQVIQEAHGYALERVNKAKGEANRFNAIFSEYRLAKEVTRQRIYLETMNSILPRVGKKLIVDEEIKGLIPLLDLKKEVSNEK